MPAESMINSEHPAVAFPQHECGIFAVFGHPNAAVLTYYGLFALQHRGQESAGIVTSAGPAPVSNCTATWVWSRKFSARKSSIV
jgi:Glutamine phosphoribosylpyrophosphate amidotransferase